MFNMEVLAFILYFVAVLAIGILVYVLTKDYTIAGGVTILGEAVLAFIFFTFPEKLEGLFPAIIEKLSLFERFTIFTEGILDLASVVYLILVSVIFVFITVQAMEKRRWS